MCRRLDLELYWAEQRLSVVTAAAARDANTSVDDIASAHGCAIVHCMGGLGRAGTIGGCVLVAGGMSATHALADVARARGPNAPETEGQKAFVRRFSEVVTARASR